MSPQTQANISRIENGKRKIGKTVAKKLARHLKIDYMLLLKDYIMAKGIALNMLTGAKTKMSQKDADLLANEAKHKSRRK